MSSLTSASKSLLKHYKEAHGASLFLRARWHLTPYTAMSIILPQEGPILDLGCGHGLFAMTLALNSKERQVIAIDHDRERVDLAREASKEVSNLRFETGDIATLSPLLESLSLQNTEFAGIAMIDVLHYFPPALQTQFLRDAYARLAKGGTLIFREVNPQGGLTSRLNRAYEKVSTFTGITQSQFKSHLYFRTIEDWKSLARETGFTVSAAPCSHFLFADILYVCRKPH